MIGTLESNYSQKYSLREVSRKLYKVSTLNAFTGIKHSFGERQ